MIEYYDRAGQPITMEQWVEEQARAGHAEICSAYLHEKAPS